MCFAQGLGPAGDAKMYVSHVPDSQAWETERVWSVMCFVQWPSSLQQMTTYRCRIIMIAPGSPGMSWFWDLMNLPTKLLLRLPLWVNRLTQLFNRLHNKVAHLNLHVWGLESVMNIQEDSQRKWRNELRSFRGTPQGDSVNQLVYFGSGVKRARYISQTHYSRWSKFPELLV